MDDHYQQDNDYGNLFNDSDNNGFDRNSDHMFESNYGDQFSSVFMAQNDITPEQQPNNSYGSMFNDSAQSNSYGSIFNDSAQSNSYGSIFNDNPQNNPYGNNYGYQQNNSFQNPNANQNGAQFNNRNEGYGSGSYYSQSNYGYESNIRYDNNGYNQNGYNRNNIGGYNRFNNLYEEHIPSRCPGKEITALIFSIVSVISGIISILFFWYPTMGIIYGISTITYSIVSFVLHQKVMLQAEETTNKIHTAYKLAIGGVILGILAIIFAILFISAVKTRSSGLIRSYFP